MAIHIRKDDGRVLVVYRDKETGKIRQESFGKGKAARLRAEKRNRELGFGKRFNPNPDLPTFGEIAHLYLSAKTFNESSRSKLIYKLEGVIEPHIGNIAAESLSYDDLDNFMQYRRSQGVKSSTIRADLTIIKAILNFAAKRRPPWIAANPIRDYPMPKHDYDIIDPPTVDEVNRILSESKEHLRRFILLSFYMGARPGSVEVLSLTWPDVDFNQKWIRITSADKGGPRARNVPIHPLLLPDLKRWYLKDGQKGPIIHYRGKPIQKIWIGWKKALRRAGITRRLRPYDLRHHFVTHALENGADMKSLAEVVGSKPETLMRHYQHVTMKQRADTVALMPDLKPRNTRNTNAKTDE